MILLDLTSQEAKFLFEACRDVPSPAGVRFRESIMEASAAGGESSVTLEIRRDDALRVAEILSTDLLITVDCQPSKYPANVPAGVQLKLETALL